MEPAAPETQPLQVCSWPHAKSKTWNQAQCMPVTNTSSAHAWNECMSASTRPRHSARAPLHTAFVCDVHAERAPRKRAGVSGDHTGDHYYTHRSETERESPLRAASCERRASRGSSVSVLSLSRRAHASNRRRYIFSSPKVPHERSSTVWSLGTLISRVVHLTRLKLLLARVYYSQPLKGQAAPHAT